MAAAVSITDPAELVDERDDDREDEFAPERVSFFAGEQHEREIATGVWRIFLRESVERGFEQPDRARRLLASAKLADRNARWREAAEAHRARTAAGQPAPDAPPVTPNLEPAAEEPPHPTHEKDRTMSELADRVTEHHAALRKQLGRDPTNVELVAAVGASVEAVRSHAKRLGLELADGRALRKSAGGGRNPAKRASKSARPKANGKAHANGHARGIGADEHPEINGIAVGGSLAIMALQAERTKIAAELEAIDKVIARMARA